MKILKFKLKRIITVFFLLFLFSFINIAFAQYHLTFTAPSHQYVQLETQPPQFGAASFTIEIWFNWTGGGTATSTGGSGISAIPLITKGRAETDKSTKDMNYFLGIYYTGSTYVLAGDFEEGTGSLNRGLNHPIIGNATVSPNIWHHAAATFDAASEQWKLYLDGNLDASVTLSSGIFPQSSSIQYAAIASALNSTATPDGYFDGSLDEARIWDVARTQSEIQSTMTSEISSPPADLIGYWKLNDGSGSTAVNTIVYSPAINGTLFNSPNWVSGNFSAPSGTPADPTNLTLNVISSGQIDLGWNDNSTNESFFDVERSTDGSSYTQIAQVSGNTTSYQDHNLNSNTTYYYRVRAWNVNGYSGYAGPVSETTISPANDALLLNGSSDYVSFGQATGLNAQSFTVEVWFNKSAGGVSTFTGNSGITAIPLITKGMADNDNPGNNVNYFLGINSSNQLAADFEDNSNGGNHPITGTTTLTEGVWYHAAFTYDNSTGVETLYLNGNVDNTVTLSTQPTPDNTTLQFAALGSALGAGGQIPSGQTQGFFKGYIDLSRIWNIALTQTQIQTYMGAPISTPTAGLVGQWTMDEGTGDYINGSAGTNYYGTFMGGMSSSSFQTSDNPFPVELVSFNGSYSENKVELNWHTATEVNNYGFEVERLNNSSDNNSGWQKIGFVQGHGNSNSPKNYSFVDEDLSNGTSYQYRLKQIDNDGKFEYSNTVEISVGPSEFTLYQNYPNPFNPTTTIKYSIQKESQVELKVYDVLGNEVSTLVSSRKAPGNYEVAFNAANLASGIYFYKIQAGNFSQIKKMIVIK